MSINKALFTMTMVTFFMSVYYGNLASQGESLEPIVVAKEASIGKTYSLTLKHVNVERDRHGAYLRLFDDKYKTIFVYVSKGHRNKIANLERDSRYNYRFKITKNDRFSTLSASLIDVSDIKGKPISGKLKSSKPDVVLIKLDGPDAVGKVFTLPVKLRGLKEDKGQKIIDAESADAYRTSISLKYGDGLAEKVGALKASREFNAKFRLNEVDYRLFGELVSIE